MTFFWNLCIVYAAAVGGIPLADAANSSLTCFYCDPYLGCDNDGGWERLQCSGLNMGVNQMLDDYLDIGNQYFVQDPIMNGGTQYHCLTVKIEYPSNPIISTMIFKTCEQTALEAATCGTGSIYGSTGLQIASGAKVTATCCDTDLCGLAPNSRQIRFCLLIWLLTKLSDRII